MKIEKKEMIFIFHNIEVNIMKDFHRIVLKYYLRIKIKRIKNENCKNTFFPYLYCFITSFSAYMLCIACKSAPQKEVPALR